jgi:hypothetical protein
MSSESYFFKLGKIIYEVIPEEDGIYTIFKNGEEHIQLKQLAGQKWFRIDYKTDLPIIEENEEVAIIGRAIAQLLKKQ